MDQIACLNSVPAFLCDFPGSCFLPAFNKSLVDAVNPDQFLMCSMLNDLSVVDHKDLICVTDRLEPMGDHDDRFFLS